VSLDPVFHIKDGTPRLRLSLTARGRPQQEGTAGVLQFLDLGREYVVRTFAAITTSEMHEVWRRRA
jgi:hypothetical protein